MKTMMSGMIMLFQAEDDMDHVHITEEQPGNSQSTSLHVHVPVDSGTPTVGIFLSFYK